MIDRINQFLKYFKLVLNGLIIILFAAVILHIWDGRLAYLTSADLIEYVIEYLEIGLMVRILLEFPFAPFIKQWNALQRIYMLGTYAVLYVLIGFFFHNSFIEDFDHTLYDRIGRNFARQVEAEDPKFVQYTYVDTGDYIELVRAKTPPDARIAYISDHRAHIASARLYPREVYMLPELQEILNVNEQAQWIGSPDPLDFPDPRREGETIGFARPDGEAQLAEMIRKHNINWLVVFDHSYDGKSLIEELDVDVP